MALRGRSGSGVVLSPASASLSDASIRAGLLRRGEAVTAELLTGGVSSEIWKVNLTGRTVCVKRALPRLKVEQEWLAPLERNTYEVAWIETVGEMLPSAVPGLVVANPAEHLFVMEYLPPQTYPLWKTQLRDGQICSSTAERVGKTLAQIHGLTANQPTLAARFPTDHIFAIRLEPYLVATARQHPDLSTILLKLVETTAATHLALVHGDVSPKNIVIGPHGPVFLDAECAWYGDPAFDLAFCLNHLLLKCLWRPPFAARYLQSFQALYSSYLEHTTWEPIAEIETRTATLLPGLLLARIDGKSPVEYIDIESDKNRVRRSAKMLLLNPPARLSEIRDIWQMEFLEMNAATIADVRGLEHLGFARPTDHRSRGYARRRRRRQSHRSGRSILRFGRSC